MIGITVNGEHRSGESGCSVADLVEELTGVRVTIAGIVPGGTSLGVAVAVNSVIVPRAGWTGEKLVDGDAVEIVSATQGG